MIRALHFWSAFFLSDRTLLGIFEYAESGRFGHCGREEGGGFGLKSGFAATRFRGSGMGWKSFRQRRTEQRVADHLRLHNRIEGSLRKRREETAAALAKSEEAAAREREEIYRERVLHASERGKRIAAQRRLAERMNALPQGPEGDKLRREMAAAFLAGNGLAKPKRER